METLSSEEKTPLEEAEKAMRTSEELSKMGREVSEAAKIEFLVRFYENLNSETKQDIETTTRREVNKKKNLWDVFKNQMEISSKRLDERAALGFVYIFLNKHLGSSASYTPVGDIIDQCYSVLSKNVLDVTNQEWYLKGSHSSHVEAGARLDMMMGKEENWPGILAESMRNVAKAHFLTRFAVKFPAAPLAGHIGRAWKEAADTISDMGARKDRWYYPFEDREKASLFSTQYGGRINALYKELLELAQEKPEIIEAIALPIEDVESSKKTAEKKE